MAAHTTQHSVSDADFATFHPPEGAVVIATAVESSEKSHWSIEIDDDRLTTFAPTAFVCLRSAQPPVATATSSNSGFEHPCGEVGGAHMTSQSAQVPDPDKGIASNCLQEQFNVGSHRGNVMQLVLDLSVAKRLGIDCQNIQAAMRSVCAVLVRQECGSLFQTAEHEVLDCVMKNAHSLPGFSRSTQLLKRILKRTTNSGENQPAPAAPAPQPFMWMLKSAMPAGEDGLVPNLYAKLPSVKQFSHSIVPPTVIPGDSASVVYAPSTAQSHSVFNDHLSEGGHMPPQGSTSSLGGAKSHTALSEPLTESEPWESAPREQDETSSWHRAPEEAQKVISIPTCESETGRAQGGIIEQSRAEAQARQLAEAEAAALQNQAERQKEMRELKEALERESKAREAVAHVGNLCSALSSAPFLAAHLPLHGTTVPMAPPSHTTKTSSATWQCVAHIPAMKQITNTNVYTGLLSLNPPHATNRMFVVRGGATKISSGTLELAQEDVLVLKEPFKDFTMNDITIKGGMVLVHAAQKVVLEGCRFVDCTLVVVSGADVELKDADFTQGENSTYSCSMVAFGEGTALSVHGGKVTGGTIGVSVYGGATASLTEVAVEQISVLGIDARDDPTRVKLTGCSFQNFSSSGLARTHAVHAHTDSRVHLDTVHIQGETIDYGVLVHTTASVCALECTVNDTKKCGAEISGGGTGELKACQFERNEMGVLVTDQDSVCDARRCTFQSSKTGVLASRLGKVLLQQCDATGTECAYRATSGATMRTTECTSKQDRMGWHVDMAGTRLIGRRCVGTDAQGPMWCMWRNVVHVAGGATADFDSCSFSTSTDNVVQISSSGTIANLVGCCVSKGKRNSIGVYEGAHACLKRCTLSYSSWDGFYSSDSQTKVIVIDCVSEDNGVNGFQSSCGAVCAVSGSCTVGNGGCGYLAHNGGCMNLTDCCSEKDEGGGAYNSGGTLNQEQLCIDRVCAEGCGPKVSAQHELTWQYNVL